ncbi:MAG: trypsin-like peptidase domain-containing protein [Chitinispirillaceae bacterium]|nr:trypsin-like peptidase domain-containing protein [Chitinispirillaceae bacterium]
MHKLSVLLLLTLPATLFSAPSDAEIIGRIKKATVYIKVRHAFPLTGDEVTTTGTGFFISKFGHIITNYHVVQPRISIYNLSVPAPVGEITVIRNSGAKDHKAMPAALLTRDEDNDIALLKIADTTEAPFITFDIKEKLFETMPVRVSGYPFGDQFTVIQRGPEITVSKGSISALRHDDRGTLSQIQIDAPVNPGNSGGPVTDESGGVIGVVRMIYATGVNFIVPGHFVDSLLEGMALDSHGRETAALSISATPSDAILFLDGKPLPRTSSKTTAVPRGWHTISIVKPGYEQWMDGLACNDTRTVAVTLLPHKNLPIYISGKKQQDVKSTEAYIDEKGIILLKEDFDSPERFEKWEQSTGGTDKRTWFLEKGTLNQFESNEMLHAIYLGDTTWTNYRVSARVRITDEHEDSRAGIIFRETSDGFYLFRIHRETDKAQIAYHCKQPFGWFVIREKKLDVDIKDKWYAMTITASGNDIACFLDKKCVFAANAEYSNRGRIGFYSVESKSAFDSLTVSELPETGKKASQTYEPGVLSFWFSDYFTQKSGWWYQYIPENNTPAPWLFGNGGCAFYDDNKKTHCSEFTKYLLADFSLNLLLSLGKGDNNSSFELFFRKNKNGKTTVRFSNGDGKISLVSTKGKKSRTLKSASLPDDFFGSTTRLFLEVNGGKLSLGTSEKKFLEFNGKLFPAEHGRIGFAATHVPSVVHEMTISSVKEEKKRGGRF